MNSTEELPDWYTVDQLAGSLDEDDTVARRIVADCRDFLPLKTVIQAVDIAHELEARYWACKAFMEEYDPNGNYPAAEAVALRFVLGFDSPDQPTQ